jgi:hypothetical protein
MILRPRRLAQTIFRCCSYVERLVFVLNCYEGIVSSAIARYYHVSWNGSSRSGLVVHGMFWWECDGFAGDRCDSLADDRCPGYGESQVAKVGIRAAKAHLTRRRRRIRKQ